jgi:hypothetical protein
VDSVLFSEKVYEIDNTGRTKRKDLLRFICLNKCTGRFLRTKKNTVGNTGPQANLASLIAIPSHCPTSRALRQ